MLMYFPNRLELSFLTVFALPKADKKESKINHEVIALRHFTKLKVFTDASIIVAKSVCKPIKTRHAKI